MRHNGPVVLHAIDCCNERNNRCHPSGPARSRGGNPAHRRHGDVQRRAFIERGVGAYKSLESGDGSGWDPVNDEPEFGRVLADACSAAGVSAVELTAGEPATMPYIRP
jgi:hypothetical protein